MYFVYFRLGPVNFQFAHAKMKIISKVNNEKTDVSHHPKETRYDMRKLNGWFTWMQSSDANACNKIESAKEECLRMLALKITAARSPSKKDSLTPWCPLGPS
jgi:hypothetical protein